MFEEIKNKAFDDEFNKSQDDAVEGRKVDKTPLPKSMKKTDKEKEQKDE